MYVRLTKPRNEIFTHDKNWITKRQTKKFYQPALLDLDLIKKPDTPPSSPLLKVKKDDIGELFHIYIDRDSDRSIQNAEIKSWKIKDLEKVKDLTTSADSINDLSEDTETSQIEPQTPLSEYPSPAPYIETMISETLLRLQDKISSDEAHVFDLTMNKDFTRPRSASFTEIHDAYDRYLTKEQIERFRQEYTCTSFLSLKELENLKTSNELDGFSSSQVHEDREVAYAWFKEVQLSAHRMNDSGFEYSFDDKNINNDMNIIGLKRLDKFLKMNVVDYPQGDAWIYWEEYYGVTKYALTTDLSNNILEQIELLKKMNQNLHFSDFYPVKFHGILSHVDGLNVALVLDPAFERNIYFPDINLIGFRNLMALREHPTCPPDTYNIYHYHANSLGCDIQAIWHEFINGFYKQQSVQKFEKSRYELYKRQVSLGIQEEYFGPKYEFKCIKRFKLIMFIIFGVVKGYATAQQLIDYLQAIMFFHGITGLDGLEFLVCNINAISKKVYSSEEMRVTWDEVFDNPFDPWV